MVMRSDIVMMATSHEFTCIDIPINRQRVKPEEPNIIGNDCWIGTSSHYPTWDTHRELVLIAVDEVVTHLFLDNCIWLRI